MVWGGGAENALGTVWVIGSPLDCGYAKPNTATQLQTKSRNGGMTEINLAEDRGWMEKGIWIKTGTPET